MPVTLLELVERDIALKGKGKELHGPCPFCRQGRDRFVVFVAEDRYWCRQCDKKGDAIQYVRDRDGLTFAEAKAAIGVDGPPPRRPGRRLEAAGEAPPDEPPPAAWQARGRAFADYCIAQLRETAAGAAALTYLRECRGLSDATVRRWRLGYNPRDVFDAPARWGLSGAGKVWLPHGVVIPCEIGPDLWYLTIRRPMLEDGEPDELARYVGGAKKDDPRGKYIRPRGHVAALFGADTLDGKSVAVDAEGEIDAMLLDQDTASEVGVCTMGGVKTPLTARWFLRLAGIPLVLAAHDADEEGDAAAEALERMSPRVKRARPIGAKDLDEMRRVGRSLEDWLEFYVRLHGKAAESVAVEPIATDPQPPTPLRAVEQHTWDEEQADALVRASVAAMGLLEDADQEELGRQLEAISAAFAERDLATIERVAGPLIARAWPPDDVTT